MSTKRALIFRQIASNASFSCNSIELSTYAQARQRQQQIKRTRRTAISFSMLDGPAFRQNHISFWSHAMRSLVHTHFCGRGHLALLRRQRRLLDILKHLKSAVDRVRCLGRIKVRLRRYSTIDHKNEPHNPSKMLAHRATLLRR